MCEYGLRVQSGANTWRQVVGVMAGRRCIIKKMYLMHMTPASSGMCAVGEWERIDDTALAL